MGILVVDDDPAMRRMLLTVLEEAGYSDVSIADSATTAFSYLGMDNCSTTLPGVDLVLMDISMPEMDGVEACRRIKSVSHLRDIPVLMVTGLVDTKKLEDAFAAGAVDYIVKPLNVTEMLARVRSALDLKLEMDRRRTAYVSELEGKNRELRLAFIELEQKNRQLEEASRAKTQILATATHELKTPLTSIIGYVDRLLIRQESVGQLNEKQRRYLETVQKNAHRLKALVEDLLDVSRIEAGSLQLSFLDLDVRAEVEDVIQSMSHHFSEKEISVAVQIPADLGRVRADRLRFNQVMSNLLSNACKYSPAGSTVTVAATQDRGGPPETIQISVSDSGIGISPDDLSKLFTKFFRADNTSTREVSGYGLGLYITRHLVEAHGGVIWAESRRGRGCTFHFTLPRANGGANSGQADSPYSRAASG
jgi:signal transduction histidine kinase